MRSSRFTEEQIIAILRESETQARRDDRLHLADLLKRASDATGEAAAETLRIADMGR